MHLASGEEQTVCQCMSRPDVSISQDGLTTRRQSGGARSRRPRNSRGGHGNSRGGAEISNGGRQRASDTPPMFRVWT